ncbi:MAG TPA: hypothetical protein PLX69_17395 [Leptospiraceae bacterium]|nr:hypothetical protein [Leptospiraceae bacterium]
MTLQLVILITTSNCLLDIIGKMQVSNYASEVNNMENCDQRSKLITERIKEKHAYLYLKIPALSDEYLEYDLDLKKHKRRDRSLPIYIEFNGNLVNPLKADAKQYSVSSKIKEKLISENTSITVKNCLFMALGSEYLIPIPAGEGLLSVIFYFNVPEISVFYMNNYKNLESTDIVQDLRKDYRIRHFSHDSFLPIKLFDQFIDRGLQTEVNFKTGKIYQLEVKINSNSNLPRKSYNAASTYIFETMNTVPGFTITLKELPPNTKFAFDGKDDVGKTYEQVKKEFILYDKDAEKKNE